MITTKLITLANIQDVKSISLNVNETKQLSPYILEAQNFDLRELLGDAFYLDLISDFPTLTSSSLQSPQSSLKCLRMYRLPIRGS